MKRLHKLNNPNTPLPVSGSELADVIKNAATGALEVLQQSYSMPNFCEPFPPFSVCWGSQDLLTCYEQQVCKATLAESRVGACVEC